MGTRRARATGLGLLLLGLCAGPPAPGHPLRNTPRLLGDPGGLRSRLERLGLTLQLFTLHFGAWRARGGARPDPDEFGHSASYDLFAHADLEELTGARGLSALLHLKGQYDRNVNAEVGALSDPYDDADFDEALYVSELWAQQSLLGGRLRLRAGLLEQQTVFDRNAYANSEDLQFMATFLDNDGVVPLPSGIGATLLAEPADWLELAAGVADADNRPPRTGFSTAFDDLDDLTGHLEATVKLRLPGPVEDLPGRYRVGAFLDGRERLVLGSTRRRRGHPGAYLSLDQLVLREPGAGEQGLGLFARLGYADEDVNPVAWFGSAGLQYRGLVPGRDADVLGLGAWQARAGGRSHAASGADLERETGLELYYSSALLPWLAVTPDLQLIFDPGALEGARNAVALGLRVRVAF